jgi:hypothetical protein
MSNDYPCFSPVWHVNVIKQGKKGWDLWCAKKTDDLLNNKIDRVEFQMARFLYEAKPRSES